jgi:hypothetical protein
MKKIIMAGLIALMFLGVNTVAQDQDWYHDRDGRYHGDEWRAHVFAEIRTCKRSWSMGSGITGT